MTSLASMEIAPRAARDLRKLDGRVRRRVKAALEQVAARAENLDVKAISGHAGWLRLRVGEHRVLYRPISVKADEQPRWLVARVVDRKELERAIAKLP